MESTLTSLTAAGIRTIEIEISDTRLIGLAALTSFAPLKHAVRSHGLHIHGLVLPPAPPAIGDSEPNARTAAVASLIRALDLAAALDAGAVTISPGHVRFPDGRTANRYEDVFHHATSELASLRFAAATRGVCIACRLANASFLTSPLDAREFLDRCNSPWVTGRLNPTADAVADVADWLQSLGYRVLAVDFASDGVVKAIERFGPRLAERPGGDHPAIAVPADLTVIAAAQRWFTGD